MDDQGKPERKLEGDDVVGERSEEKRRKLEDDDVGEREEKEGPSQVLPPSCHSVFCCYDGSDTEEEDLEKKNGSDYKLEGPSQVMPPSSRFVSKSLFDDDSDSDSDDYFLDIALCQTDIDFLRPLDPEASKKYNQEIRESEGFDIFYFPGLSIWTPIVPLTNIKESSEYEPAVNHAKLAINNYNIENNEAYEFVDLERVNTRVVEGCVFYITFQVKNLKAAAGNGDNTPLETFQARVWEGITETEVELCRPKPVKLQN